MENGRSVGVLSAFGGLFELGIWNFGTGNGERRRRLTLDQEKGEQPVNLVRRHRVKAPRRLQDWRKGLHHRRVDKEVE